MFGNYFYLVFQKLFFSTYAYMLSLESLSNLKPNLKVFS